MSLRVLVVDDTVVFRKLVSDALSGVAGVEVVGTAANGKLALSRIEELKPDLVTLDLEMPEMNGIDVLQAMARAGSQAGVIVLSARNAKCGELTVRALELGAFDFITKPEGGGPAPGADQIRTVLAPRVQAFQRRREIRQILGKTVPSVKETPIASVAPPAPRPTRRTGPPIVLIGISTGGPAALAEVLPALPPDFGAPILIVQHMPPMFTGALAQSLDAKCAIRVKEAQDGEIALPGKAYLAPGGKHLKTAPGPNGELVLRHSDDAPEHHCRPAVDVLFRSVAEHFPGRAIAAVLTGMGSDGTIGLKSLKQNGGCVSIAQDEASCTVFGMPREAIRAGVADHVVPLSLVARELARQVKESR